MLDLHSIRERNAGPTAAAVWHAARILSRLNLPLPNPDMGTPRLPVPRAYALCHTISRHGPRTRQSRR